MNQFPRLDELHDEIINRTYDFIAIPCEGELSKLVDCCKEYIREWNLALPSKPNE